MKKFWPLIVVAAIVVAGGALDLFIYEQNVKMEQVIFGMNTPAGSLVLDGFAAPATNKNITAPVVAPPPAVPAAAITPPLTAALGRVTKKPFGIYVHPGFSPVTPERFTGYHTGIDFETTAAEQEIDVPIDAICPGQILIKEWASGYGGVLNESCTIKGQAVTVTYGHLRLASITKKIGQTLMAGEQIGMLGTGYSHETDNERKHLHLGIHLGKTAVISGYVATAAQLKSWVNVLDYLKPGK